jgi:hypothetical protein
MSKDGKKETHMAKIQILGEAAVLTSAVKKADLELLKKFKPAALQLKDEEGKEVIFAATVGKTASITKYGVNFAGEDVEGYAQVTGIIPSDVAPADKATYVKDNFGYALLNLNKLENQILGVLVDTRNEFAAMDDSIQVM